MKAFRVNRDGFALSNIKRAEELDPTQDPFAVFVRWLDEARVSELNDPEAMSLATVDREGYPDVRMVLCKGVEHGGLVFYTNSESAKGRQIASTGKAAALFHWKSLRRQVRFRGQVSLLDENAADVYFSSRPRQSQLGAWASQQSRPLFSREHLEARVKECAARWGDGTVPRPDYWRGYHLLAHEMELWADGDYRLHDRVKFSKVGNSWASERLFP